jgi:hypothetical protein
VRARQLELTGGAAHLRWRLYTYVISVPFNKMLSEDRGRRQLHNWRAAHLRRRGRCERAAVLPQPGALPGTRGRQLCRTLGAVADSPWRGQFASVVDRKMFASVPVAASDSPWRGRLARGIVRKMIASAPVATWQRCAPIVREHASCSACVVGCKMIASAPVAIWQRCAPAICGRTAALRIAERGALLYIIFNL